MGFVVSRFTGFGALQRFHEAQVSGSIEVRQGQSESPRVAPYKDWAPGSALFSVLLHVQLSYDGNKEFLSYLNLISYFYL